MSNYFTLPGSKKTLLPNSRPAGRADPSEIVSVTVRVRSRGSIKDLEDVVKKLASEPLASRQYLTHAELAEKHGALEADLDEVEQFAQKHNLMTAQRSAAERTITLQGRLGDLTAAFRAHVALYHHASGTYRGRLGELSVPEELHGVVTGVFGFDTRRVARAPHRTITASSGGPGGKNGAVATAFAKQYNFPTTQGGVTLDGTGQTIAIIELGGGYRHSDLVTFANEVKIPTPRVTAVSIDHASNSPSDAQSDDVEVMLDIEVASAVVPKAHLVVYFAPNVGDKGFLAAISAAVHDSARKPGVISISWGGPEEFVTKQGIDAYHELFTQAGALGITVCIATGDHGVAVLAANQWDGKIHVGHPASDPMVLACGGTQIDKGTDVVWNDETPFDTSVAGGGGWTSTGGISTAFDVPDYQENANLPKSIATGKPGRGQPDIAMSATNYFVRIDSSEGASGGTSAVAPLMAALLARISQARGKTVGFLNPFLYANASKGVVRDVTSGSNVIAGQELGYKAQEGWDACTGLGTPDGAAILEMLP